MFTKQTIQKQCIFVATLLFLYMAPAAAQGLVIGALDEVRQGPYSVTASQSRNLITTLFPGSTFTSSPTLTKAYLDTVQVVILASGKGSTTPIIPLSTAEQVALLNFVKAGGGAIILADNDTFGPSASDANDSLLSPFGLHVTGTLDGYQLVTITNTSSGEVTNGRFGTVASFLTLYPGWFDNLGPHAIALGLLSANQQPALAVIHSGTLNPGSGCVVLLADGNIATNDALFGTISTPDAQTLIANAIACVGAVPGPPPLACPNGSTMDSDGDALLDCWEKNGIDSDGDGTPDFKLYDVNKDGIIQSSEQADPNHKDIYLEIDWMDQHKPDPTAIANVISSFANAPVTNPDGSKGIRLHIQTDEEAVAHNNEFAFAGCTGVAPAGTPEFDSVKSARFGTASERGVGVNALNAKRLAFHYSLFVHSLLGLGSVSGCAERPGNDFVVSLGGWWPLNPSSPPGTHGVGNVNEQSGTLMHELGHNLGLRHGGGDNFNFKPNYLSVMSYARQISGWYVTRPLDYSFVALPSLDETNLNESTGIGFVPGAQTAFGVPPLQVIRVFANAAGPIDWNLNGPPATDTGVAININDFGYGDGGMGGVLMGYNDWANIWYDFRATMDFADGIHLSTPESMEVNIETAALNSPDSDGDGIVNVYDICPLTPNADQKDRNGNGVGDVCEGDLDHDGDVDKHDLKLFLAVRNTPASGPNDPMDLNGDGKITGLDAQKLVLNCTRPRCATHPRHR